MRPLLVFAFLVANGCRATGEAEANETEDAAVRPDSDTDAKASGETAQPPGCGVACSIWQVQCGDHCVDTTTNPNNCGRCGVRCDPASELCQGGVCAKAAKCNALPATEAGAPATEGLRGEYFAAGNLTNLKLVRVDSELSFDWTTDPPDPQLPHDNYSARWTGELRAETSGTYTLYLATDDGTRLYLDDKLLIDSWVGRSLTEDKVSVPLVAGQGYALRIEYFQVTGPASVKLSWSTGSAEKTLIPKSALRPPTTPAPAFTCTAGDCCPTSTGGATCCPAATRCVVDPSFTGCCPVGETCTACN